MVDSAQISKNQLFGFTVLGMNRVKGQLKRAGVNTLMTNLPQFNLSASPISGGLMNQIYDARALKPDILNNYLKKVDEFNEEEQTPSQNKVDYKTITDELMSRALQAEEDAENPKTEADASESDGPASLSSAHYGIVGDIFDKYA